MSDQASCQQHTAVNINACNLLCCKDAFIGAVFNCQRIELRSKFYLYE